MRRLKQKVKNRARVEGSIAESYVMEELVNFCSLYFEPNVQTKHNRLRRNEAVAHEENGELTAFSHPVRPFGGKKRRFLTDSEYAAATLYALVNMNEVAPYIK